MPGREAIPSPVVKGGPVASGSPSRLRRPCVARLPDASPTLETRLQRLRALGLSDYASRAYMALLELGSTEAREVSRLARIPVAKVYATLDALQEKGLVIVSAEMPKQYRPAPLREYVDRLAAQHIEEASMLQAQRERIDHEFPIVGTTRIDDRGGVTTLRGRRMVNDRMRDLMASACDEILYLAPRGALLRTSFTQTLLASARERGVTARVLVPTDTALGEELRAIAASALTRPRPIDGQVALSAGLLVCDARIALLAHHVPDDARGATGQDVAFIASEPAHVALLHAMLTRIWHSMAPLDGHRPPG